MNYEEWINCHNILTKTQTYGSGGVNRGYKKDGGIWGYKDYRRIRKLKKDHCEYCLESPKLLHLHHRDGNTRNSNVKNLITLCPTCHAMVHPKLCSKKKSEKKVLTK